MQTINNLVKVFSDIATNHKQINSFGFGDLWEVEASGELKGVAMWLVLGDAAINNKTLSNKFTILIMDLVNKDETNENEVLSDTLQIAIDVYTLLNDNDIDNYTIVKSPTFAPFTERFDNEWAGWTLEVTINQPFLNALCEVPTT